ncbi:MAG: NADH-quinone oxidoreductase subunit N [Gemmataceae bacterium]|nr:NADH-quinone oxidoreductase subunit N [Gemmataceae bacterium]
MTRQILDLLQDGLSRDLVAFLPELILCGTIVLLLLLRLFTKFDRRHLGWVALVLTFYALLVAFNQWIHDRHYDPRQQYDFPFYPLELFGGLLVYDNFTVFVKLFLFGFTTLVILLNLLTGIPDREDSADFFCLLLGATLGMSIMASSNHLLMVFLGIEMASVPSYVLAGFLKGRRQSSEASLKYVVYGGGAAGVMLYGMSLLAGQFGTGYLPDLLRFISQAPLDPMILLGILFVLIGIGFKLAAVPFHFWCPDVFEGAAAEVAGFLSVASKGAALALLARITLGLGGLAGVTQDITSWQNVAPYLVPTIAFFAALTMTFGNLAAYAQTNLKRLLAYSTIAHAGFMMMGLATLTREGAGAVLFYLIVYLFMNLGAFAVVAYLRNLTGSEELSSFRGLVSRSPLLVVTLGIFLLSLLGMPPLGGFAAKFQIFAELYNSAQQYAVLGQVGLTATLYALLVIGGLNTVLSLFYYVKVLKVMALERSLEEVENRPVEHVPVPGIPAGYLVFLAAAVVALGIFWDALSTASYKGGVDNFHPTPTRAQVLAKGAH